MAILLRYVTCGTLFFLLVTLVVYEADLRADKSRFLRAVTADHIHGLSLRAPNSKYNEGTLLDGELTEDIDVTRLGVKNLTTKNSQNQFLQCAGAEVLYDNDIINISTHLWPCKKMSFQRNGPIIALGSNHRSGNLWVRQLLEAATGIYTGSIYCDSSYVRAGMIGEGIQTENVLAIETLRQPPSVLTKTKADKAIYIIRNPFECITSEWARHQSKDDEEWNTTVRKLATKWLQHVLTWLTTRGIPTLVVEYDDLKMDTYGELKRMLDFIGYPYTEDNILCAIKQTLSNSFHRNHTKQFDSYSPVMRQFVNEVILQLSTALEKNSISLHHLNSNY